MGASPYNTIPILPIVATATAEGKKVCTGYEFNTSGTVCNLVYGGATVTAGSAAVGISCAIRNKSNLSTITAYDDI